MMRSLVAVTVLAACGSSEPAPSSMAAGPPARAAAAPSAAQSAAWRIPEGWRGETFAFPLEFAPSIAHRGAEELRFPPGFLEPGKPGYWSYAFTWRTEDAALLDAARLGGELTVYFKGLIAAVDEQHRIDAAARESIAARAEPDGPGRWKLSAHVIDAFKTGAPVDLVGWAERTACERGALWVFVLARADSPLRGELDALARSAACGAPPRAGSAD
ncbi:MAG TPA: hypothetical protein VKB80_31500 [Kofleriaceae bacterium]|nr:hypothetical protein [Kofleriaceae bacterium]